MTIRELKTMLPELIRLLDKLTPDCGIKEYRLTYESDEAPISDTASIVEAVALKISFTSEDEKRCEGCVDLTAFGQAPPTVLAGFLLGNGLAAVEKEDRDFGESSLNKRPIKYKTKEIFRAEQKLKG